MALLQSEIFELVSKATDKQEKVNILRKNDNLAMRALLRINFDPNFNMNLPEGEPPFKKEVDKPIGYQETNLLLEQRRFYIWLSPQTNLSPVRKERLFIEMLEGLHYSEAEAICLAKDKKLTTKYPGLIEKVVREAFPTLLPAPVEPKVKKNAHSA
jgi:hypothetical protein